MLSSCNVHNLETVPRVDKVGSNDIKSCYIKFNLKSNTLLHLIYSAEIYLILKEVWGIQSQMTYYLYPQVSGSKNSGT